MKILALHYRGVEGASSPIKAMRELAVLFEFEELGKQLFFTLGEFSEPISVEIDGKYYSPRMKNSERLWYHRVSEPVEVNSDYGYSLPEEFKDEQIAMLASFVLMENDKEFARWLISNGFSLPTLPFPWIWRHYPLQITFENEYEKKVGGIRYYGEPASFDAYVEVGNEKIKVPKVVNPYFESTKVRKPAIAGWRITLSNITLYILEFKDKYHVKKVVDLGNDWKKNEVLVIKK